jgi:hypothetical protein
MKIKGLILDHINVHLSQELAEQISFKVWDDGWKYVRNPISDKTFILIRTIRRELKENSQKPVDSLPNLV